MLIQFIFVYCEKGIQFWDKSFKIFSNPFSFFNYTNILNLGLFINCYFIKFLNILIDVVIYVNNGINGIIYNVNFTLKNIIDLK